MRESFSYFSTQPNLRETMQKEFAREKCESKMTPRCRKDSGFVHGDLEQEEKGKVWCVGD